jgi:hypothetical protein
MKENKQVLTLAVCPWQKSALEAPFEAIPAESNDTRLGSKGVRGDENTGGLR